jgi:hypothetical protein
MLEKGLPVSLNPIVHGFCRGPKPHELTNQTSLSQSQRNFDQLGLREGDFRDLFNLFDEFRDRRGGSPLSSTANEPLEGIFV